MYRPARNGVSLLEVVFSIGVVMVGLLGVAALLPVGGAFAHKGAIADKAAALGTAAVRDFQVRGMAQPWNWRWYNTAAPPNLNTFVPFTPSPGQSFCLDPRFIAGVNAPAVRNKFPYNFAYDGSILWMPRITLSPSPAVAPNLVMGKLQADQLFQGHDDLVFDLPKDRTLGPIQNFGSLLAKRQVEGKLSWLATIVPKLDRIGNPTDEYTLSIVVFAPRKIDEDPPQVAGSPFVNTENSASERVVMVGAFYSGQPAVGGGDLRLVTRPARPVKEDLELRAGDWVMLSSVKPTPAGGTVQVHKWYRVANAGEDIAWNATSSVWWRDVTLIGPDWDWAHMGANSPLVYNTPTQVTIARGAVAVFEKTIRLELSSLWTN